MKLVYKPDFEEAQQSWARFWKGEAAGPLCAAVIPKPGKEPVEKPHYAGVDGNFEPVVAQLLAWADSHEFLGAAIPFYYMEWAAVHFASFLGAEMIFREDGHGAGWAVPCLDSLEHADIRFRPDGKWWKQTERFARALRAGCDGKLLLASPTIDGGLDTLAALRGTEPLLLDLVERPAAVHRALEQVTRAVEEVLDAFAELLDYERYGSINRHGMYCRGRTNIPQCDSSCMISNAMFREFEVPCLTRQMEGLDAVEYHLDGPGALQHLETLCSLPRLDIIQWVSGSGWGEAQDWSWLYRKIDDLGKGQIRGASPERAEELARTMRSKKIFVSLGVKDREEAARAFERVAKAPRPA